MSEKIFMALLVGAFFLMAAVFFYQRKKREKQIEELIMYLMRIQDGPELPEWTSYREGQLGILQSEIYKLVMLLHEKSSQAVKRAGISLKNAFRYFPSDQNAADIHHDYGRSVERAGFAGGKADGVCREN